LKRCLILALLSLPCFGSASNIYITSSGSAAGSCTSNVKTPSFFNSSSNWGSGSTQIGPGTVVTICGTFTGTAGGSEFNFQASGTSGNPITLLCDTVSPCNLTSPYWGTGGAINISGYSYVVVDGNGAGGTNGIIQDTANGDGKTYQQDSVAILGPCTPGCEIRNWLVENLYVSTGTGSHSFNEDGFYYTNGSTQGISIHDNVAHDIHWILTLLNFGATDSGLFVYNNYFYNMDHGIAVGIETTGYVWTNLQIHDNHFGSTAVWDTGVADAYHHDGIHFYPYCNGSSSCDSTYVSGYVWNNLFDGNWGVNNTAFLFCENYEVNLWVFNNVFNNNQSGVNLNNGATECGGPGSENLNNTYLGVTAQTTPMFAQGCNGVGNCSGNNMTSQNNAFAAITSFFYVPNDFAPTTDGLDYNAYLDCLNGSGGNECWVYLSNQYTAGQFSSWQSEISSALCTGCEAHSFYNATNSLTSVGVPNSGSPVLGAGKNLTSLCNGSNPTQYLCYDTSAGNSRAPVARPSTGAWAIGAYETTGSSTYSITVTSPSNGSVNDSASQNLISCPSTCTTSVASGPDTLVAVPAGGYGPGVWGGGTCSGSDATPCSVSGTATVTASFTASSGAAVQNAGQVQYAGQVVIK
jgi:hypothetical protein